MDLSDKVDDYDALAEFYLAQGKFDEALKHYEKALKTADEKKRREPHNALFKIFQVYPRVGNFYIQIGEYEKAKQYLKEDLDTRIKDQDIPQGIATSKNGLGMSYYYAGDDATAEKLFKEAGGLNARSYVAFPVDLAQSLTMLGRIEERRGASDEALKYYQSTIKMLVEYPNHTFKVEQADVQNQIGRFYVKQGKPNQAAEAYGEAIRLRQETDTQTHPNCADAIKGLADVAAMRNELTSATLQAQAALKILDTALVPTHPRIAPTLVVLASINALTGQSEAAAPLHARLETILQKPLGPWKEDFLETTAFYAGMLKKAGKTAEAGKLEAIQARQKDRR
jgi:tetratricopeptide (TPR) repeat protein